MSIVTDQPGTNVARIDGFRDRGPDEGPIFSVEQQILVEPRQYRMVFVESRTALLYQRAAKVALKFRIVDPGPAFGKELERWYNVKRLIGKPCRDGRFQVGPRSDFLREYLTLFPGAARRFDRMSFAPFRNVAILGRVETVTHNRKQQLLPEAMRYSIIRELLETGA